MKWVAGALLVLAVAVVAAALIIAHRPQHPIDVNIDGQLRTCTTQSLNDPYSC